jgi:SPP1 gp7 family putative phage head morphogenesis protein
MLNAREPKLRRVLFSTRNAEASALKYQEVRNALRTGELSAAAMERFRQAYSSMVVDDLGPMLSAAAQTGARTIATQGAALTGRSLVFEGTTNRIDAWLARHGSDLVVDITTQQRKALRLMTRVLAQDGIGPRDGARYLRAAVGLTEREASAVNRLRTSLVGAGELSPDKIVNRVEDYAGFLARRRADRIARTELSYAFNQGTLAVMREAVSDGAFTVVYKMWYTPNDERTCEFCAALHEQVVGIESTFPAVTARVPNTLTPPAHPNCRCTLIYVTENPDG